MKSRIQWGEASINSALSKMASWKLVLSFIIAFTLIFISSPLHVASELDLNSQRVNLSVYYEALCPSCASFIVQNLVSVFNNDLINIINLRMVPWGNAHINRANNTIVCQHGPDECLLNTIHSCAINVWHDVNQYFALVYCIEFLAIEGRHKNWQTCFNSLGLPEKPVLNCYNNGNGTKLDFINGYETGHLSSPRIIMPWVVVNNQPIGNDYKNFTAYVCNAYKGNAVPRACEKNLQHVKAGH